MPSLGDWSQKYPGIEEEILSILRAIGSDNETGSAPIMVDSESANNPKGLKATADVSYKGKVYRVAFHFTEASGHYVVTEILEITPYDS